MAHPVEPKLDPVMDQRLAIQPVGEAGLAEELDRRLLEHACPDALFDVLAAARFQHDGPDALQVQEMRQHEAGRAGPDDPYLCPHAARRPGRLRTGRREGRRASSPIAAA